MITLVALLIALLLAASLGLGRSFLRGLFGRGTDVFVVLEFDGKTLVYKNPNSAFVDEDKPLESPPQDIFYSDRYDTYYNVCWFDCGALFRCGHSYHRTPESARYCERNNVAGSVIGKVVEER